LYFVQMRVFMSKRRLSVSLLRFRAPFTYIAQTWRQKLRRTTEVHGAGRREEVRHMKPHRGRREV
jgi:hypothetical protein